MPLGDGPLPLGEDLEGGSNGGREEAKWWVKNTIRRVARGEKGDDTGID